MTRLDALLEVGMTLYGVPQSGQLLLDHQIKISHKSKTLELFVGYQQVKQSHQTLFGLNVEVSFSESEGQVYQLVDVPLSDTHFLVDYFY